MTARVPAFTIPQVRIEASTAADFPRCLAVTELPSESVTVRLAF